MELHSRFDSEKALEALLYVANKCPNLYHALKVLYFADKEHLSKFGRSIYGERYVAMRLGPVPSGAYDLVKYARGDSAWMDEDSLQDSLKVEGHELVPLRQPKLELLSESDIECLNHAIEEYGRMSFGKLKQLSHDDSAYKQADENDFIPFETLVKSLPNGDELWDYLSDD